MFLRCNCFNKTLTLQQLMPGWRNWQTCTLEGRMSKDVGVRLPFRALNKLQWNTGD